MFDIYHTCPIVGPIIYHYTSIAILRNILSTQSLRFSHIKNTKKPKDYSEFLHGIDFFWKQVLKSPQNRPYIKDIKHLKKAQNFGVNETSICIFSTSDSYNIKS